MNLQPLISVCVITYGQEEYIEQTLSSILQQNIKCPVEIIVANDCSPDNTDTIIKKIISKNTKSNFKFRYYKHENNIGAIPNFYFALKKCEGKYIAICEGDDYWIKSDKLKKQINFLENNENYSCCFHDVKVLYKDRETSFQKDKGNKIINPVSLQNLLESEWLIPTCSFVFRRENMILPPFFDKMRFGDFVLFCSVLLNSNAYYLQEKLGAYRRDNFSSMTNATVFLGIIGLKTDYIQFLNWLSIKADPSDKKIINARIDKEINEIRNQISIYRNSKFMKLYMKLRVIFNIN